MEQLINYLKNPFVVVTFASMALLIGAIGCALSAGGDITISPPAVKGSLNFDGGSLTMETTDGVKKN